MLPYLNYSILRTLHEDRIRDAQRPVPEWIGIATPRKRERGDAGVRKLVRNSFAKALRRLAASVDPQGSPVNA